MTNPSAERILRLWYAAEVLTLADLPEPQSNVHDLHMGMELPWLLPEDQRPRNVIYVLHLGELAKAVAAPRLISALDGIVGEFDYRGDREFQGDIFTAALYLDENGCPLKDTPYELSSPLLAWHQRVISGEATSLTELRKIAGKEFNRRTAVPPDLDPWAQVPGPVCPSGQLFMDPKALGLTETLRPAEKELEGTAKNAPVPFDWDRISREENTLRHLAPGLFEEWRGRIMVERRNLKGTAATDRYFSMDFYVDDLQAMIAQAAKGESLGVVLDAVLSGRPEEQTDILADISSLGDLLHTSRHTNGRWPSDPAHHLAMGQQAAVGSITGLITARQGGLRAVNGPPGTGKTTLLRDVMADIITRRAEQMWFRKDSADLFRTQSITGQADLVVPIAQVIAGTGIVVTSSNNSAVENISLELPAISAIDSRNFPQATYFPDVGGAVLGKGERAWGCFAARLGNSSNRRKFAEAFLSSESSGAPDILGEIAACELSYAQARRNFYILKQKLEALRSAIEAGEVEGARPADRMQLRQPDAQRHRNSFNVTPAYEKLRSEMFLAALDLHRAALKEQLPRLRHSFERLKVMLTGGRCSDFEARLLWDLLFMVVPVISTTLASLPRMFKAFGKGGLPWVMVDEAGQATPGAVAGALWRARKAILVGDPRQVEPVSKVSQVMMDQISEGLNLSREWSPSVQSAQTLADRTMSEGAWIGDEEAGGVWGGLPLRAHRRCAEPMFSLANRIAYDDQMVQAGENERSCDFPLGASAWIDVPPLAGHRDKVSLSEIAFLERCLTDFAESGVSSDVFLISPFRQVSDACVALVRRLKKTTGFRGRLEAGSVHTFQGKEADVVFIVLGTAAGAGGAGSRAWAGQSPNILNVALTRAKKRVYIVGALSDWREVPYFKTVAEHFKVQTPAEPDIHGRSEAILTVEAALNRITAVGLIPDASGAQVDPE